MTNSTQQVSQFDWLLSMANIGVTEFEQRWHSRPSVDFAAAHINYAIAIVCGYLLMCLILPKIMKKRKAFELTYLLALWNFLLSVFSLVGALRTVPFLLHMILTRPSWHATVCEDAYAFGTGPIGFWVMLFIFSKIPELFDTVLLIVRKKPVIFLHWYHHASVLMYCWHAFATEASAGIFFVAMNYSVHAIMYAYYSAAALKLIPRGFPSHLITNAQISQMFVGMFVCASTCYYKWGEAGCKSEKSNLIAAVIMYTSYFYLFVEFAFTKYKGSGEHRKEAAAGTTAAERKTK